LLLLCSLGVLAQASETDAPTKTIRLLTIGNSFAVNISAYLPQITQAGGYKLVLCGANIGSCSLEKHWKLAELHEANPTDANGMPYAIRKNLCGLKEALQLEPWDYVSIQQYSMLSEDVSTYRPYARNLYDYIRKYAPRAEVLMFETWPYRNDDPKFHDGKQSAASMYRALSSAYRTIASELGVRMLPVGDAFALAANDPSFTYAPDTAFDFTQAKYPALPDQTHSLHAGWSWAKDQKTGEYALRMDGHHANQAGQYLGGLIFFARLTGQSVVGNTFIPKGMSAQDARALQTIADRAVGQRVIEEAK
jgi:hypothetical protein